MSGNKSPQQSIEITDAITAAKIKSGTALVTIDNGQSPTIALKNPAVSATAVEAGNPFVISGTAEVQSYPYKSNRCLSNIRIGLLLPKGVTVNLHASTCGFPDAEIVVLSDKDIPALNKHIVLLQFNSEMKIGYATEDLKPIKTGSTCNFSIALNTERTTPSQTIELINSVFLSGKGESNAAQSGAARYATADVYDLNGNNSTTDKVGTFDQKTVTTSISIIGAPAQLDVEGQIRKIDGTVSTDTATMEDYTDYFYYDLTISNTSGGVARDFTYLIPLLTQTDDETDFVSEREDIRFVLLNRPVLYTIGDTDFDLYYTTTIFQDYDDAYAEADSAVWFPYSALTEAEFSEVTMLKIRTKDNAPIQHGDSVTVSLYLNYHKDALEYLTDAGKKVTWASRGYYNYEAATSSMAGHLSSNPITVSLKAVIIYVDGDSQTDLESVHLTADANDTANLELKTDAFDLQAFDKGQTYTVAKVGTAAGSTGNVVLVPYDSAIPDPNSNNTFGIQVQITYDTGSGTYQSPPTSLHEVGAVVGEVNPNTPAKFTFYLSHGKAISQNTEGLMANIILLGDNGVAIDITIDIHRVLTQATAGESGLFAGEVYIMQDDALQDSVSISNRSTLTAQFSNKNVTPNNYGKRVLTFNTALPQGTIITMADLTDTAAPKYYYYPVNVSNLTSLELTAFCEMGSSSTPYQYSTLNENIYETFLFIFSFPTNQTLNHTTTITFTLSPTPEASASDPTLTKKVSDAYSFSVQDATTFSLTTQERVVDYGDSFTLTVTSTPPANDVPDNYYYSQRMTLVLQSSSPNAPLPSDATLFVEDKEYHPDLYGRFIIPLESVGRTEQTLTRTMRFRSFAQPFATLHASLYTHNGAEGLPFGGEPVGQAVEVNIRERMQPSLLVTGMRSRILHRNVELKADVSLGIRLQNIGANDMVTLEIQQKTASAYSTMTTALNTLNGSAKHEQGVFFVQIPSVEDPTRPYDQSLFLRFNSNIPAGTYRVLFTVTTRGHSMTVPYEFIVAE